MLIDEAFKSIGGQTQTAYLNGTLPMFLERYLPNMFPPSEKPTANSFSSEDSIH